MYKVEIMKEVDKIFTEWPFYGKRRISAELKMQGYAVGVDLVRTLMRKMGLEALLILKVIDQLE